MSSRKRRRSDDSAVDKLSVVQRDFDLFKREQERERKRNLPPQDGEIMLDMEVPPSPCSSSCSFCRSHSGHPFVYMCKTHFRIHVCGSACQEKIMSRENWTCPWTNEVIGVSLIAEDKASSSNCGRHIASDAYNSKDFGDQATQKNLKKRQRIHEAMLEAASITAPALDEHGIATDVYARYLCKYFGLIYYHTDMFGSQQVLTKKAIVQFGLACSYLHRTGFSYSDQVCFFAKKESFSRCLPKTHALILKNYKVRAITRTQDLLKTYLTAALDKAPDLDLSFRLPEPDDSADA